MYQLFVAQRSQPAGSIVVPRSGAPLELTDVELIELRRGEERLVRFDTWATDSTVERHEDGAIEVHARVPCFFARRESSLLRARSRPEFALLALEVQITPDGSLETLELHRSRLAIESFGSPDCTPTQIPLGSISLVPEDLFESRIPRDLFRPKIGELSAIFRCSPGTSDDLPPVNLILAASAGTARASLGAFGVTAEVAGEIQQTLIQIPPGLHESRIPHAGRIWYIGMGGLPHNWASEIWNASVGQFARAAELLLGQEPSGHLPLLRSHNSHGRPSVEPSWVLVEQVVENRDAGARLVGASTYSLAPRRVIRPGDPRGQTWVKFPRLRNHLGEAIEAKMRLERTTEVEPSPLDRELSAKIEDVFYAIREDRRGLRVSVKSPLLVAEDLPARSRAFRAGALDVFLSERPGQADLGDPGHYFRILFAPPGDDLLGSSPSPERIEVRCAWWVETVVPGGQDEPNDLGYECDWVGEERFSEELWAAVKTSPGEREEVLVCATHRDPPLIVPSKLVALGREPDWRPSLKLEVEETFRRGERPRIQLTLSGPSGKSLFLGQSVVVLDRDPFLVGKVRLGPKADASESAAGAPPSGGAQGNEANAVQTEIANWRNFGIGAGAWYLPIDSFGLTLPPQGMGETMERYGTLGEGQIADFRFSPQASLELSTARHEQSFREAPWNLRHLLGDPLREQPGVNFEEAEVELFYGLACSIDGGETLRLAEVGGLVGHLPGPLPRSPRWSSAREGANGPVDAYQKARLHWERIRRQWQARLAVLEPYESGRISSVELLNDVTCYLRRSPFEDEVSDRGQSDNEGVLRRGDRSEADLANPISSVEGTCGRDSEQGLCGGITWGFESRNVYRAVLRNPESSEAEIRQLRFSSLGGWGRQRAKFDQGRTTLYADVAMGRGYSYTVERLGRIGCWWNWAKHVIVYERQVVPSRQFLDSQNALGGRPVLRKVREYVEILQNRREFPDSGGGDLRFTGPVEALTFSEDPNEVVRFHVKSSWGTDVRDPVVGGGWKVPLWLRGAEPSDVYPKPRVRVDRRAVIDGESRTAPCFIDDPENLFFYTWTVPVGKAAWRPGTEADNPDTWPAVLDIDYCDAPACRAAEGGFAEGQLRRTTSGDSPIPVGHDACTFRLESSEHPTDLVAFRPGAPMAGRLQTITMARAQPVVLDGESTAAFDPVRAIDDEIGRILAKLPSTEEEAKQVVDRLGNEFERVTTQLGRASKDVDAALRSLQTPEQWLGRLDGEANEGLKQAVDRMLGEKGLKRDLQEITSVCYPGNGKLLAELELLMTELEARISLAFPSPAPLAGLASTLLHRAASDLDEVVLQAEALAEELSRDAGAGGTAVTTRIDRVERQAQALLRGVERIEADLQQVVRTGAKVTVDAQQVFLPGVAEKTLGKLRRAIALSEIQKELRSALSRLRELRIGIKERQTEELESLSAVLQSAVVRLGPASQLAQELRSGAGEIDVTMAAVDVKMKGWIEQLHARLAVVVEEADELSELGCQRIQDAWETEVDGHARQIDTYLHDVVRIARAGAEEWCRPVVAATGSVAQTISDAKSQIAESIEQRKGYVDELRMDLEAKRDQLVADLESKHGEDLERLRRLGAKALAVPDAALRIQRAFGEPPEVSGLIFDRAETAFFYQELDERVGITPVVARAKQASHIAGEVQEALQPLGIALPVHDLGDRLIPAELKKLSLSDVFPNFAGLQLDQLFPDLAVPEGGRDGIKVRHGLDPQTRTAWFEASVDVKARSGATVFATGPLALRLIGEPHFTGAARMKVDSRGSTRRKVRGRIDADWQLEVGGTPLVILRRSNLRFDDNGEVRFEVSPRDAELPGVMAFVTQLLEMLSGGSDGLSVRIEPTGVVSVLSLPLPDMQAGTFGVTSLSFNAALALRYAPEFSIDLDFSLARPDAPFALTVFILGGGGYLVAGSSYTPATGIVKSRVAMAVTASASLAIALGPISGGVYVYFGITGRYESGEGGGMTSGILFLISGRVSLLGIVSASITLRLAAEYDSGALVGSGSVSIKIKICWCFTLEVDESVTYTLAGSKGARQASYGPQAVTQIASAGNLAALALGGGGMTAVSDSAARERVGRAINDYLSMLE